jgi:hypothetical protein
MTLFLVTTRYGVPVRSLPPFTERKEARQVREALEKTPAWDGLRIEGCVMAHALSVGDTVAAGMTCGIILLIRNGLAWVEWEDGDNSLEDIDTLERVA